MGSYESLVWVYGSALWREGGTPWRERASFFKLILKDGEDFVRMPVAQCGREMGMPTSLVKYRISSQSLQQGMLLLEYHEILFGSLRRSFCLPDYNSCSCHSVCLSIILVYPSVHLSC